MGKINLVLVSMVLTAVVCQTTYALFNKYGVWIAPPIMISISFFLFIGLFIVVRKINRYFIPPPEMKSSNF